MCSVHRQRSDIPGRHGQHHERDMAGYQRQESGYLEYGKGHLCSADEICSVEDRRLHACFRAVHHRQLLVKDLPRMRFVMTLHI